MINSRVTVNAGVCGFVSEITAAGDDDQMVKITIDTPCANIKAISEKLSEDIDAYQELGDGFDGAIYSAAKSVLRGSCIGCAVPSAIFKSMQIASELALPVDVSMKIEKL
jgi:hypothetical protein